MIPVVITATRFPRSLPQFVMTGVSRSAAMEIRERLWAAVQAAKLRVPHGRIVITVEPALPGLVVGLDVPVFLAVAMLHGLIPEQENLAALGQLQLDGSVETYEGCLAVGTMFLRETEFTVVVPAAESAWERCAQRERLIPISTVQDGMRKNSPISFSSPSAEQASVAWWQQRERLVQFPRQVSQQLLQAGMILAVGSHHALFFGNPGQGKTYSTKVLQGLFPPWTAEDVLQFGQAEPRVSYCSERITEARLAEYAAGCAGGVLFLDELSENSRAALEFLKEPLDGYPAPFPTTLVGSLNPCRCGRWGTDECRCLPNEREQNLRKLSGALWDRFHVFCRVESQDLQPMSVPQWKQVLTTVSRARSLSRTRAQQLHFPLLNRDLQSEHLAQFPIFQFSKLDRWRDFLKNWSWRKRLILARVALTLADLDNTEPNEEHLFQAYQWCQFPAGVRQCKANSPP